MTETCMVHAGITSVLPRLTTKPMRLRPRIRAARKKVTAGAVPAQRPSSRSKGAEVEARGEGVLSDLACLLDDGVDGQSKEDRPQRIAMLSSPGAWNGLSTGALEKTTVMATKAVDPRSERGEVGADRLQDSGAMHCVEGILNVH